MTEALPSRYERISEVKEMAKSMKIQDLKLHLTAMGVMTSSFVEDSDFLEAYAEAIVKKEEEKAAAIGSDQGETLGYDEDPLSDYPPYVVRRVDALRTLEDERGKLMSGYLKERAVLEAKYKSLLTPLFDKRRLIVAGDLDEEIAKENGDEFHLEKEKNVRRGIPKFWVCVLGQNDVVAEILTEDDIECLESLQDVKSEDDEDGQGFTLSFQFSSNDFFENSVLTKRYNIPNLLLDGEPILKNVEGCKIHWKEGRCLTHKEETRKQKGKGKNSGQIRTVTKKVKNDSFFHFFDAPEIPSMDTMNEERAIELEHEFNMDFQIALAFRSSIVPKAVLWFSGEAGEEGLNEAMEDIVWPEPN
jgi:nucleosome assembly protein 1-like 1